ncbi:MAG: imelysin family protein [Thermosynechococcaceae cyanobacterium]
MPPIILRSPQPLILFALPCLVTLTLSGCGNTDNTPSPQVQLAPQILRDFADQVVIPNHALFATRAEALSQAIGRFTQSPNANTLGAAQQAWVAARAAWEQTECFGFGPADALGYDGALDTWPVNETDLKALLSSNQPLTPESVRQMKETEKGFHAIEYFLFGTAKNRQPGDLTPRERQYLQLAGADFAQVAQNLAASWSQGVEGKVAYREVFTSAGQPANTTYPTLQAGKAELIQGMLDSLDEVANEKIGKTFAERNPQLAESRFSFNTLTDMKSNLQGVQNVYLGRFPDGQTQGQGLSDWMAQTHPALDTEFKAQLQTAMDALAQIPSPFERAILDPKAADAIKTAQSAINQARETLEDKVKPLMVPS